MCVGGLATLSNIVNISPDFRGRGPEFESGISHNDPDALQDHCVIM